MKTTVSTPDCRLTRSLMVWSADRNTFLTVHDVQDGVGAAPPTVLAGRIASQAEVIELLRGLANDQGQHFGGSGFLEPTILSVSPSLTWWRPAAPSHMWFRGKHLERQGTAAQPGLVFQGTDDGLSVFAVKSRGRPVPSTRLWQAPYPNIWEKGHVCLGNARRPTVVGHSEAAKAWESAFFTSAFTHPNIHGEGALTSFEGGVHALWSSLLDDYGQKAKSTFPNTVLVPLRGGPRTLKDIL